MPAFCFAPSHAGLKVSYNSMNSRLKLTMREAVADNPGQSDATQQI
jgi:hypothetical protein